MPTTAAPELVAGTEGERLFLLGDPWFAADDERQAIAYAGLICLSKVSAAAFVDASRVKARELLIASSFIVHALEVELQAARTMGGAAIDSCIERAVAAKAAADERQRPSRLAAMPSIRHALCHQWVRVGGG